jgi:hypothetical protein
MNSLTDQIFRYCERGQDGAFWAEPFNALSSLAFVIVGLAAAVRLARGPGLGTRPAVALLASLTVAIGFGSFLFHTLATRWSSIADVAPIGLFMLAYFIYVLRVFLGRPWLAVAAGVGVFAFAIHAAVTIQCRPGVLSLADYSRGPCLNGSLGYLPALVALIGTAGVLAVVRHPAWRAFVGASVLFLAALTFRTFDLELCPKTLLLGRAWGTHAFWHLLNAGTAYVLLIAAIRHGGLAPPTLEPPPLRA